MRLTLILTPAVLLTTVFLATGCENPNDRNNTTTTNPPSKTTTPPPRTTTPPPATTPPPSQTPPRDNTMNKPAPPPSTPSTTPPVSPSGTVAEVDRTFITDAANGGLFEVQSAQLILGSNADKSIKDMAQMIADDHSKANEELKAIAQRKGVTLPTTISPQQQTTMSQIKALTGQEQVDKFIDVQIKAHEDTISMFEESVTTLKDSELKAFAQKALPTLRKHLDQLQQHASETP